MGYQPEQYRIEEWESGFYVFSGSKQRGPFKKFRSAERYIKEAVRASSRQRVIARYDEDGNRI